MKNLLRILFFILFFSFCFSQSYYLVYINLGNKRISEDGLKELSKEKISISSLYKIFLSYYLLERGIINENTTFLCDGDGECNCWDKRGHGIVDVVDAISLSCNRFFCRFESFVDEYDYYLFLKRIFHLEKFKAREFKKYFLKGEFSFFYALTPSEVLMNTTSFLLNRDIKTGVRLKFREDILKIVKRGMLKCFFSGTGKKAKIYSPIPIYMKTGTFKKRCGRGFIYRNLSYGLFKYEGNFVAILVFSLRGNSMNNSAVILGKKVKKIVEGL